MERRDEVEQQSRATQRPWSPKDFTVIAEWLKFNEKQLALAVEATKRPEYFNPLCSRKNEEEVGSLIGALLPSVQKCRELASAFTARAMLRLNEGDREGAWEDILACHRLGRLTSRGATLIESLVGIAIWLYRPSQRERFEAPARRMLEEDAR